MSLSFSPLSIIACAYTPQSTRPAMDASARCRCGELEWTTHFDQGKMPSQVLCHCMTCKAFGSGEYTVNMMVPEKDVKMTKGKPKVYTYTGESGNPVNCFYCPNCTTHAYRHEKVPDDRYTMHLLLPDDEKLKKLPIEMEFFGKNRMPFQPEIAKTYPMMDEIEFIASSYV